jgi:A/G-specific adenine glycosylase
MLQQTRVEIATPYFERWMARFPDLASLAAASIDEVLGLWQGLGYYGRARNLHKAARLVVNTQECVIPRDFRSLRKLHGIGEYTAGAIASIAFGESVPAIRHAGRRRRRSRSGLRPWSPIRIRVRIRIPPSSPETSTRP